MITHRLTQSAEQICTDMQHVAMTQPDTVIDAVTILDAMACIIGHLEGSTPTTVTQVVMSAQAVHDAAERMTKMAPNTRHICAHVARGMADFLVEISATQAGAI